MIISNGARGFFIIDSYQGKYLIQKIKNKKATTTDGQNESMSANDSIERL